MPARRRVDDQRGAVQHLEILDRMRVETGLSANEFYGLAPGFFIRFTRLRGTAGDHGHDRQQDSSHQPVVTRCQRSRPRDRSRGIADPV